ncbi:hypothetical protein B8W99_28380 [Peribacillus simplex]|nr:hypothetical protein B8W99_28380 [Peribacillus simplex]
MPAQNEEKTDVFFSMRERHQLMIQPVCLFLLGVAFNAFQRYSIPRNQKEELLLVFFLIINNPLLLS